MNELKGRAGVDWRITGKVRDQIRLLGLVTGLIYQLRRVELSMW
jgi:hypothetical protein